MRVAGVVMCGSGKGEPSDGIKPLLVSAREAAQLLSVSRSHFYKLHSSGRVPLPVSLGRAVRWSRRELEDWVNAGGPPRHKWEHMKGK